MQDDRLKPAGHLDRTIGIAGVNDVGWIRTRTEWLLALAKGKRPALSVTIADAVSLGRHGPGVFEERFRSFVGQAIEIKAGEHSQLERLRIGGHQIGGERTARPRAWAHAAHRQ